MRYITFEKIADTVASLCIDAAYELPEDVLAALKEACRKETNPLALKTLEQIIENAAIARAEKVPLCQDTGLAVVFVEQGADVALQQKPAEEKTITDAVNAGVRQGYEKGYLRKSVVSEPLCKRLNTETNAPAVIHYCFVSGDRLKISVMTKGGGCENKSQFKMFNPTADKSEIISWIVQVVNQAGADSCPPFVVGVGIGGDFELSCLLSKKALLRNLGQRNNDKFYDGLEREILTEINKLGIGPQGFGGNTTALGCLIEMAPCHIASLPVAVNIECHSHRHKEAVI